MFVSIHPILGSSFRVEYFSFTTRPCVSPCRKTIKMNFHSSFLVNSVVSCCRVKWPLENACNQHLYWPTISVCSPSRSGRRRRLNISPCPRDCSNKTFHLLNSSAFGAVSCLATWFIAFSRTRCWKKIYNQLIAIKSNPGNSILIKLSFRCRESVPKGEGHSMEKGDFETNFITFCDFPIWLCPKPDNDDGSQWTSTSIRQTCHIHSVEQRRRRPNNNDSTVLSLKANFLSSKSKLH